MDKLGAKSPRRDYKSGPPGKARQDEMSDYIVRHGVDAVEETLRARPSAGPVNELGERDYADISEQYFSTADLDAIE